ncbi:hypothetical protein IJI28_02100 [Candidatus Saccharibacteria bacterium]|nr:hypothetical protein [Candidatus Saccharibacteria bacterium]
MDKDNYEQEFMQNIKNTTHANKTSVPKTSHSTKLPWIITAILALIVVVESIALSFLLVNYFNEEEDYPTDLVRGDKNTEEGVFYYDKEGYLIAFVLTCTSEEGTKYLFQSDNQYQKYNGAELLTTGTYSISENVVVDLKSSTDEETKYFYDGFSIENDTESYECEDESMFE